MKINTLQNTHKYCIRLCLFLLIGMQGIAQNITFSFANPQITTEASKTFYEVDIMVSTDQNFIMGLGQVYIDYNTNAFGSNIAGTSRLVYTHPAAPGSNTGYLLDQDFIGVIALYVNNPDPTNSSTSKMNLAWNQAASNGSAYSNNVTTSAAVRLAHLKMEFVDTNQPPNVRFDESLNGGLNHTIASSAGAGDGTVLNDSFDSSGATIRNWTGSAGADWHTASNWSNNAIPPAASDIFIKGTNAINASSAVNINRLDIAKGGALNSTANVNNTSFITIESDATDSGVLIAPSTTSSIRYVRGGLLGRTGSAPGNLTDNSTIRWSIITSPVAGQKISDFVNAATNNIAKSADGTKWAIGYYDDSRPANQKWVYYSVADLAQGGTHVNTTFDVGRGYAIARNTAGSVTFQGTIQTSNFNRAVSANQWNAVGNPFTAYIPGTSGDTNNFIQANLAKFEPLRQAVYVWNKDQSRYDPKSQGDATSTSLAPGQGFFVKTTAGVTNMTFTASRRSTKPATGDSNFSRRNTTPNIQLKATLNGLTIDTDIRYFDHTTAGLDPGYDVADFSPDSFDLYTKLLDGYPEENFAVQALPNNGNYHGMIVPVGLIAKQGDRITFTAETLNLPAEYEVYLQDKQTNAFTNLSKPNGKYEVTLSQAQNGDGRFYLHTLSRSLSTENQEELLGVKIFTTDANTLMIRGIDNVEARVQMYNVLGTQVFDTKLRGTGTNQVQLPNLASGVYIVRLATEKGTIKKKIVLE